MDRESVALDELERLLCGSGTDGAEALDEGALRAACSAACLAAYPDASGAAHEMDVRRLLGRLMHAYVYDAAAPLDIVGSGRQGPEYHLSHLRDALRRLRGAPS